MRRTLLALVAAGFVISSFGAPASAQAATTASPAGSSGPLLNGDFQSGDFSNWTTFTTPNGAMIANVVPFDTANNGTATYSAQFVVGQEEFEGFDVQRGGGIFQDVLLVGGELSVSVDIASEFAFPFCNEDGATIQLLVDGVVVDSHTFGEDCGPIVTYEHLNASVSIGSAGTHEIRLLITRAFLSSGVTNYLDNVVLSGRATETVITVPIDIKPGSTTNPVKLSSTGRTPIAILSTSTFDATTVDPTTVCFGDAEAPAERDCTAAHSTREDVNGDGRVDLLLLFDTGKTGIDPGDRRACMTGTSFSGIRVDGCDSIKTL